MCSHLFPGNGGSGQNLCAHIYSMFFFQFINLFAGNGGFGHSGGEITIRTTLRTQGCDEVHDINVIRLRPI